MIFNLPMDEIKKQKKDPCSSNCHINHVDNSPITPSINELKLITKLTSVLPLTPCLCYLFLKYHLNTKLTCSQLSQYLKKFPHTKKILYKKEPKFINRTSYKNDVKQMYNPCSHYGSCKNNKSCKCFSNRTFCEASCLCQECDLRTKCNCKNCDEKCACFIANRECTADCHPDKLINVIDDKFNSDIVEVKKIGCQNMNIQLNILCETYIGNSLIAGYGLFATKPIKKNTFVIEYIGEVVSHSEAERRGFFYDHKKMSYLFDLNVQNNLEYQTIDATRIGNNARFINHSTKPNIIARQVMVNGVLRMGMYAFRDIKENEELLFDYKYSEAIKKTYNLID